MHMDVMRAPDIGYGALDAMQEMRGRDHPYDVHDFSEAVASLPLRNHRGPGWRLRAGRTGAASTRGSRRAPHASHTRLRTRCKRARTSPAISAISSRSTSCSTACGSIISTTTWPALSSRTTTLHGSSAPIWGWLPARGARTADCTRPGCGRAARPCRGAFSASRRRRFPSARRSPRARARRLRAERVVERQRDRLPERIPAGHCNSPM